MDEGAGCGAGVDNGMQLCTDSMGDTWHGQEHGAWCEGAYNVDEAAGCGMGVWMKACSHGWIA